MIARQRLLLIAACLTGLAATGGAWAQTVTDGNVSFQSTMLRKKPKDGLPDVKAPPQAWPRLDPGATLCRTEDDLDRLAARRSGESVGGPIDCRRINDITAINITQRLGPGKTQVTLTSGQVGTTGWTDAWLPDKAPPVKQAAAR